HLWAQSAAPDIQARSCLGPPLHPACTPRQCARLPYIVQSHPAHPRRARVRRPSPHASARHESATSLPSPRGRTSPDHRLSPCPCLCFPSRRRLPRCAALPASAKAQLSAFHPTNRDTLSCAPAPHGLSPDRALWLLPARERLWIPAPSWRTDQT